MSTSDQKVLNLLQHRSTMSVDLIVLLLPEFSWNEVFSALKRLSDRQLISLTQEGFKIKIWYKEMTIDDCPKKLAQRVEPNGRTFLEMKEVQKVG